MSCIRSVKCSINIDKYFVHTNAIPMFARIFRGANNNALALGGLLFVFTGLVVYLLPLSSLLSELYGSVDEANSLSAIMGSALAAIGGLLFAAVPILAAIVLIRARGE